MQIHCSVWYLSDNIIIRFCNTWKLWFINKVKLKLQIYIYIYATNIYMHRELNLYDEIFFYKIYFWNYKLETATLHIHLIVLFP